jgi:murein DD-endopeptidase MepM/ murein hydrolase activator NlpD
MRIEPATCPTCGGAFDPLRARDIRVLDGKVRAYCSPMCKLRSINPEAPAWTQPEEDKPRSWKRAWPVFLSVGLSLVAIFAVLVAGKRVKSSAASVAVGSAAAAARPPEPTTMSDAMAIMAGAQTGASERWVHPLLGPARKMPDKPSRRFGAPRDGMRPDECRSGHCGVDLGESRGDTVMAVHDGVIERVVRDPGLGGRRGNEGRFIRVSHKGGTVVSSYIHLDGVREDLKPGIPVKAGEVIGTVGDTGVQSSGPHLHFAISVRKSADDPELYIDPEPLLYLWPLVTTPVTSLHRMEPPPPAHPKTAKADTATTQGL